jgi:hypothetical protein
MARLAKSAFGAAELALLVLLTDTTRAPSYLSLMALTLTALLSEQSADKPRGVHADLANPSHVDTQQNRITTHQCVLVHQGKGWRENPEGRQQPLPSTHHRSSFHFIFVIVVIAS